MKELIQADGVKFGQSENFSPKSLKDKSRALATDAQNGIVECISESVKLSESSGAGYEHMRNRNRRVYSPDGVAPTLTCCGLNVDPKIIVEGKKEYVVKDGKKFRVRKFTELERFRLMGVKDEDYKKIAKNQSPTSLCHLSGDSIVVDVLMAIFGQMI